MSRVKVALILPATAVVCTVELWRRGLVWPIVTTAAALLGRRTVSDSDEADVFG